jgi:membrane protein
VMLWIQINSLILLIGFELNASIAINRDLKEEIADN